MAEFTQSDLVEYIKCVKKLEVSLYGQKQALKKMENEAKSCEKDSAIKIIPYEKERWVGTDKTTAEIVWGKILAGAGIGFLCGLFLTILGGDMGSTIVLCIPIGGISGIAWGVSAAKQNRESDLMERAMETHRVKKANERISMRNEENKKFALIAADKKTVVDAEIKFLKNNIAIMSEQLQKYYDLNIIYPKYRGLIYVCSICEYMEAGRCDSLVGPYGAYNMLENDIKFARVVEKMDNIISNLEQIKENQNELYYAIRETNNQLAALDDSIKKVAENINRGNESLDRLNSSIDNIEYNSKISAESEQFTAAYRFFKN